MFEIEVKKHGISITTVWYAEHLLPKKGIISYREAKFKTGNDAVCFDTLLTDLTLPEEEIIGKISKNGRYEIRRAAKENVEVTMLNGTQITPEVIGQFCDFFVEFWKSKGVAYTERDNLFREISTYVHKNAFALTYASMQGKPYVYHTYLVDDDTVRLYHSASLYRVDEAIPHSLIGMANRYLHKEDMMFFKQAGKAVYDWGGAGETEDVKSITEFKKSFGGEPVQYYDFHVVNGWKAQIINLLADIKGKLKGH